MKKLHYSFVSGLFSLMAASFAMADDLENDLRRILSENPEIVLDIIRQNPEIVLEAAEIFQAKNETAQKETRFAILKDEKNLIFDGTPIMGNPNGDVTIVEFFDYNCGYCKRFGKVIRKLLKDDPNLRMVMQEFPILGEGSEIAARAALAAQLQNKYDELHWALMRASRLSSEAEVMRIAKKVDLDLDQLRVDMYSPQIEESLKNAKELAVSLGISGTPSLIVGDQFIPGFISDDQLRSLIEAKREMG